MSKPVLLFSGPPRSGKSTVARKIAEDFGLFYVSPGELLRELADGQKIEYHKFFPALSKKDVEEMVDAAMELINEGGYVIDGRYEPLVCSQRGIFVPAVYLTADFEVRAQRDAAASGMPLERTRNDLMSREQVEIQFCRKAFNGDYRDPRLYVGSIDTTELDQDGVYDAVLALLGRKRFLITPHE